MDFLQSKYNLESVITNCMPSTLYSLNRRKLFTVQGTNSHVITILHKSSHIVHFRKKFYVGGRLRGKDWNKRLKYKMQELVEGVMQTYVQQEREEVCEC